MSTPLKVHLRFHDNSKECRPESGVRIPFESNPEYGPKVETYLLRLRSWCWSTGTGWGRRCRTLSAAGTVSWGRRRARFPEWRRRLQRTSPRWTWRRKDRLGVSSSRQRAVFYWNYLPTRAVEFPNGGVWNAIIQEQIFRWRLFYSTKIFWLVQNAKIKCRSCAAVYSSDLLFTFLLKCSTREYKTWVQKKNLINNLGRFKSRKRSVEMDGIMLELDKKSLLWLQRTNQKHGFYWDSRHWAGFEPTISWS